LELRVRYLDELDSKYSIVSMDFPLISNLSVIENISLIKEYHYKISQKESYKNILELLKIFDLDKKADYRNPSLIEFERFIVMLIRACMIENAIIIIDRPFGFIKDIERADIIFDALNRLSHLYRDVYIFDYIWHKDRYGRYINE